MNAPKRILLAAAAILGIAGSAAHAATVFAAFDSAGRSTTAGNISKANNSNLAVGPVGTGDYFRTYLTFDLAGASAASGVTTLTLSNSSSSENNTSSSAQVFTLFQLLTDWDGVAQPGPAGTALATVNFTPSNPNDSQNLVFSSAALTVALNGAIGGELYLGIRTDLEGTGTRSFKWFDSSEDPNGPKLDYSAVPEPGAPGLAALGLAALVARRRRL